MTWHIHSSTSGVFDSDAYGVDTDNPPAPFEILDNAITPQCERSIQDSYNEWLYQTAREYFDTWNWDEDFWDAWKDIAREITI